MFQRDKIFFIFCAFVLVVFFSGCLKSAPEGNINPGAVALTFDDDTIDNWHDYLPLLQSLGIKATFYISKYHRLNKNQKEKLKSIAEAGHEIAYHTTNHNNMVKACSKVSIENVIQKEIDTDLKLMKADGYKIENFAYPYGSHNALLDKELLKIFKSVRALSNHQNYYKSLVKNSGEGKVLHAGNIDMNSKLTQAELSNLINNAQAHQDCLVLVAHQINIPGAPLQITADRLKSIAAQVHNNGLQFVTISHIAF